MFIACNHNRHQRPQNNNLYFYSRYHLHRKPTGSPEFRWIRIRLSATKRELSQNDFSKSFEAAPLFGTYQGKSDQLYQKNSTQNQRGKVCLSKSVLFFFFIRYAAPGTNRWFPNRPVCILWCSFSMLKAILTRYHSTITLALPLVRKRRKFMSSLIMANTPSA